MAVLNLAVQKRRDFLINELVKFGYFKTTEGKQLYELTLSELEHIHITVKCKFGKQMQEDE
ncbi:hypothetical protein A2U94_07625 [Bacillus sp. VT 712]|jgi:Fur-regulated basic protein A|uniref:Fur-regulated basic protein FbpA n=1 Tax=Priestia veravalensis TaxID=1414648 RepID=A0A0V8JQJ6_9BACI|nr:MULTISPECIES: Fur-regulated basic protein FbpA [Bacillaceae]KSU88928.1 hypothetical protein AS180_05375 [Priestia veravalensis]KZB92153.1 hypothetical protein A2U94_07625 [Bacillus sp. VT 712]MCG7314120.1 Fur-regulated basic protein FbpA [Priestia flexa]MCM3066820.1 Fur-regulated basic protein FbpA [Priestia flexa]MED4589449.1 Fur-regulated basic protein FbpA [Priestia flexa]